MLSGVLQFSGVRVILRSLRSQGNQHLFHIISPLSNIFSTYLLKRYKQSTPIYLTINNTFLNSFPQKVILFHRYYPLIVNKYHCIKKRRGFPDLSQINPLNTHITSKVPTLCCQFCTLLSGGYFPLKPLNPSLVLINYPS